MARSRRDLAILALIETKFRNFMPTYPHHDVFAPGKVADRAACSLETLECCFYAQASRMAPFELYRLQWGRLGSSGRPRRDLGLSRGGSDRSSELQNDPPEAF